MGGGGGGGEEKPIRILQIMQSLAALLAELGNACRQLRAQTHSHICICFEACC